MTKRDFLLTIQFCVALARGRRFTVVRDAKLIDGVWEMELVDDDGLVHEHYDRDPEKLRSLLRSILANPADAERQARAAEPVAVAG